jgi:hypothetical protein
MIIMNRHPGMFFNEEPSVNQMAGQAPKRLEEERRTSAGLLKFTPCAVVNPEKLHGRPKWTGPLTIRKFRRRWMPTR